MKPLVILSALLLCACHDDVAERAAKGNAEADARQNRVAAEAKEESAAPFRESVKKYADKDIEYNRKRIAQLKEEMTGLSAGGELEKIKLEIADCEKRIAESEAKIAAAHRAEGQ